MLKCTDELSGRFSRCLNERSIIESQLLLLLLFSRILSEVISRI